MDSLAYTVEITIKISLTNWLKSGMIESLVWTVLFKIRIIITFCERNQ